MTKARTVELTSNLDSRGLLVAAEFPGNLPFVPVRMFIVTSSPAGTQRGGHAHRTCHQFLVGVAGSVIVEFDDGNGTQAVTLNRPTEGLYIPPLVWAVQSYDESESSLLVLASHPYDLEDYVDDRQVASRLRQGT